MQIQRLEVTVLPALLIPGEIFILVLANTLTALIIHL